MSSRYVVSSCLLGTCCKYNGGHNRKEPIIAFLQDKEYICVCPEILGGLPCPRACCEIKDGSVIDEFGNDVSQAFEKGASLAMEKVLKFHATHAILQPRSPSCGSGTIYSGDFNHTLVKGNGWFAQTLIDGNVEVINADDIQQYLEECHKKHSCG